MERPAKTTSIPVHDLLAFTALCQVALYLWYTDRISGTVAASGLLGAFLFMALLRAVKEAFVETGRETPPRQPAEVMDYQSRITARSEGTARVRYE